jgi:hypothetical protein
MTKVLIDRELLERALKSVRELIPDSDSDYAPAVQGVRKRKENVVKELRAALAAPQAPAPEGAGEQAPASPENSKMIAPAPLTDEQIDAITEKQWGENRYIPKAADRAFARAIEKAHGITGEAQG